MAIKTIDDKNLTDIADAIRAKNGKTDVYKPSEMAAAIQAITTGGGGGSYIPSELFINGKTRVYDLYEYFPLDVTDKTTLKFKYDVHQSSSSTSRVYIDFNMKLGYVLDKGTNTTAPLYSPTVIDATTGEEALLTNSLTAVTGVEVELDVSAYTSVVFYLVFDPYSSNAQCYASVHIYDIELS